jgi:hypothetical protein
MYAFDLYTESRGRSEVPDIFDRIRFRLRSLVVEIIDFFIAAS